MKLNPDDQFSATDKSLREILTSYSLRLVSFEAAKSGIENTTLIVSTDKGKFVMRIYRQKNKSNAAIQQEIDFTTYLTKNALPVPLIIANNNKEMLTTTKIGGVEWQVILMEYLAGHHSKTYTPLLIQNMAKAQARMHILSERYAKISPHTTSKLDLVKIVQRVNTAEALDERLASFLKRAEKYTLTLPDELSWGFCHLDYSKDNLLIDNIDKIVGILDFDDMESAPYAVCLGFALYHLRYGKASRNDEDDYLANYQAVRNISSLEKSILPSVELFRHYFISSLQIMHQHRSEEDIKYYLEIENEFA